MKWINPYDRDQHEQILEETAIDFTGDPGMTLQAPAEECDLNVIMARFGVKDGSKIPRWQSPDAIYGDFSEIPDNPTELAEILRQGELAFNALPATIRRKFDNGAHMYEWLRDEKNLQEALDLGLLNKTPERDLTLRELADTLKVVSTSTSSDKEPLVPNPKTETGR